MAENGLNWITFSGCFQHRRSILCDDCPSTLKLRVFWRIVSDFHSKTREFNFHINHLPYFRFYSIKQLFRTADLMYSIPLHRATIYIFGIFTGYAMRMYKNVKFTKVSELVTLRRRIFLQDAQWMNFRYISVYYRVN